MLRPRSHIRRYRITSVAAISASRLSLSASVLRNDCPYGESKCHPARERLVSKMMRKHLMVFSLLTAMLSGCAAYQKCGLGGCPGDAEITAQVQTLFEQHPVLLPPNIIRVQTWDRVVYLSGLVDTDLQRQIAESVAMQAPGVRRVENSIGLTAGAF